MLNLSFKLDSPQRDDSTGFLICEGIAARTGVQPYSSNDIPPQFSRDGVEWYFVYRDRKFLESFHAKTSTGTVPIVNEHVTVNVDTENDTANPDRVVGWISSSEIFDTADGNAYLKVRITIKDPDAIKRIEEQDHVGLSMGYDSDTVETNEVSTWVDVDGVVGDAGTEYPYNLQAIFPTVNHLALCTMGRAGMVTSVQLDSYIETEIKGESAQEESQSSDTAIADNETTDDYKLYRYPTMDETNKMHDMLRDAISSAINDMLPKAMCDAFATDSVRDSLYGAFTKMDLVSALREMHEDQDKPAHDPGDKAVQANIQSTATQKGFIHDGASFSKAVVDSIKVWREVGSEIADSANEAMTAEELKITWLKAKGVEVNDSMSAETINSLYATVRSLAAKGAAHQDAAPKSEMKQLFDSFKAPSQAATSQYDGIRVVQDSLGGAIYL